jgi:uncharacterized membrane protein
MPDQSAAPRTNSGWWFPRADHALLLLILVVGLVWRCWGISSRCLWFDEAFTYFVSRLQLPELMARVYHDGNPPLCYLFLKVWTFLFGSSPVALRFPSELCGILAILGTYLFTIEAVGLSNARDPVQPSAPPREVALWAAALVALSAFQIRWSWEVRMYALGAALTMFSSWAVLRALRSTSHQLRWWLLYAVLALIFAYTHYFAFFTIAAQAIFVVGYLATQARRQQNKDSMWRRFVRHPQFRPALLAGVIICLGWLPWLPEFLQQRNDLQSDRWVPPASIDRARIYAYHLVVDPEGFVLDESKTSTWCCMAICAIVPLALLWKARAADWFVILGYTLPIGSSALGSVLFELHIFYSRYFLFPHLFLLVGIALLLGKIPFRGARVLIGACMLLLMVGLDVRYIKGFDAPNTPSYRGAVAYIESRRQPDEPIIVCDEFLYLPLLYEAKSNAGWFLYGHYATADDNARKALGADKVMDPTALEQTKSSHVWVVNTGSLFAGNDRSPCEVKVPDSWILRSNNKFIDRYGTGRRDLEVVEYEVPSN